jgi:hypothetical protein
MGLPGLIAGLIAGSRTLPFLKVRARNFSKE